MALVPQSGAEEFFRSRAPQQTREQVAPEFGPPQSLAEETRDESAAGFFAQVKARDDDAKLRVRAAIRSNPEAARKANRLAQWTGLPPETVERNLPEIEGNVTADRMRSAMDGNKRLSDWFGDPRRAAASSDDVPTLKDISDTFRNFWDRPKTRAEVRGIARERADVARIQNATGILPRAGALLTQGLNSLEAGLSRLEASIASEIGFDQYAARMTRAAERRDRTASTALRNEQTWTDLKAAPTPGKVANFVLEQGVKSAPAMLTAVAALPVLAASQAGNIGQQRAQNNGRDTATLADIVEAAPAAVASAYLDRLGARGIFSTTGRTVAGRIGLAAGKEAATEYLQSDIEYLGGAAFTQAGVDYATAIDQSLAGAVAGAGMGGSLRGIQDGVERSVRRVAEYRQGRAGEALLDRIMQGAAGSKLREGDPDAFEAFVAQQSAGTAAENVFIPADAIRQLYQDEGRDWTDPDDELFGAMAPDFREQMAAGLESGGDVVIPTAAVAAKLAGTPEWERLRADARLTPGGSSPNELKTIEDFYAEEFAARERQASEEAAAELERMGPRQRVFESMFAQARQAGFSINAARKYADVWAERYQTRAERLDDGRDAFTLFEDSFAGMRADMPGVREYGRADQLDILVNAMRRGASPLAPSGPSLVDWIIARGGVTDPGGDIASMGGRDVFRGGYFGRARKPLIRESDDAAQGSMLGTSRGGNAYGLDDTLRAAIEAGYFPELQQSSDIVGGMDSGGVDQLDTNALLDAISDELRGNKRFVDTASVAAETQQAISDAADDLRQLLDDMGVDPDTATKAEIERAVRTYSAESERGFDQAGDVESEAFKAWFGDSKVVDADGKPLVVYHGTRAEFEAFRAGAANAAIWATPDATSAGRFASGDLTRSGDSPRVLALYMRIEKPFDPANPPTEIFDDLADFLTPGWLNKRDAAKARRDMVREFKAGNFASVFGPGNAFVSERVRDFLVERGFDGLIRGDADPGAYAVFSPEQIKAVDNVGTFDRNDARILYQSSAIEGLPLVEFGDFVTGKPVTFDFVHNTQSATKLFGKPKKGDQFQRDLEPSGRYVNEYSGDGENLPDGLITGTLTFQSPLVLNGENWKAELSAKFGKTGKALSKAILAAGFDGVVTVQLDDRPGRSHTSEIVDLTTFDEARALYQSDATDKPLYAVHNLSAEKLRHAVDLGGLAAPSLAIARGDIGFGDYGEISLIGEPSLADPKGKGTRAFAADVYSPRQPRARFKVNDKARRAMRAVLAPAAEKLGLDIDRARIALDDIERGGLTEVELTDAAKAAWLEAQGEELPLVYQEARAPEAPPGLDSFTSTDEAELLADPAFITRIRRKYELAVKNAEGNRELKRRVDLSWLDDDGEVSAQSEAAQNWARSVARYNRELAAFVPGPTDKVDTIRTSDALTAAIGERMPAYRAWVRDQFGGVVGPAFFEDASGRKREYSLNNLVRAMTRELRNGEAWNYGAGNVRAAVTPEFRSMAEIKAARGRIVPEADMDRLKDEVNSELFALAEKFAPYHRSGQDFGWGDIFSDFMKDLAKGPRGIVQWQTEWFSEPAPEPLIEEAALFLDKLRGLPTDYFEIKMQRAMQLGEFAAAVVPSDVDDATRASLELAGLDIVEYQRGDEASRLAAVQSLGERVFFQGQDQGGKRGRIDFLLDGRAAITLFEGRDMSTVLHESAHLWLEELKSDALASVGRADAGPATRRLFADWEATKAWFKREGIEVTDDAPIPTEAHELWARGMERYFMEGKAPSTALREAFATFRAWLLRIYQVVANLNSNIDNEVRAVFDRLIASDNSIAWAIDEADQRLLFDTAAAAEMSGAEFNAYRQLVDDSRTEAFDALLFRTMERIRRSRTQAYRDEEAKVRVEVTEDVNRRPEIRALNILRGANGEEYRALDLESVVEIAGADVIAILPKGVPGKPSVRRGGVAPDLVAELAGFVDGRTMIEALVGIELRRQELVAAGDPRSPVQEAIDVETDRRMAERQPDAFDDGSIEEEALAAIHNDKGAQILAAEVRQLARKVGENPTPLEAVKAWAERIVREGRIVDQANAGAVQRHLRAEKKAAKAAEAAFLAGDFPTAFREKQRQMVAHALFRAATAAKEQAEVISRRLDRLARAKTLKGMDQDYLDQIHGLLERYDLRRRSEKDIKERESFDRWAKAQEEKGIEVFIPERLTMAGNKNFTRLTLDDLTALDDAVQSLAHLGREKKSMLLAKEEADFNALVQEAQAVAMTLPVRPWSADRNPRPRILAGLDALLTKVEFLADQLDGGNPNGVFNRVLVQQATFAANEKERLVRKVVEPLAKLYLDMPTAQQKRLSQRVAVPEFVQINPETREITATVFSKMELLAVALNTGNKSNFEKMIAGETRALPEMLRGQYGWTQEGVMGVLERELTKEDWDFVQKVWDQIETLWPDIAASERAITGIVPEKVEARVVQTSHGDYRGGYYPLVYDPTRSQIASDNLDADAERLLGQMGRAVSTPKGHTITRTEAALPITFSVERVLLNHINRVTTRIAYGRYVRDALKFINDPRIRKIVDEHAGLEYHKQLKPWLQRQVNEAALDTSTLAAFDRIMRSFRVNATLVGLGFRLTTMLAQISGWSNSVAEIGPKYMLRGMAETARNAGSIRGWVFDQSPEMASRAQAFDRDVRAFYTDIVRAGRRDDKTTIGRLGQIDNALKLDKMRAAAFWGIGMIDVYLVAMPTWVGAYYKALDEGMTIEQARAYGDKAVRKSQSAGRAKDLSAIQDSGEGYRFVTMFYSYFNILYNKQRETIHAARMGDWRRAAMNVFWIMMVGPVAGALLTLDGPDEEDGEAWFAWASRKILFGLWASLPIVRDVMGGVERKISGKFSGPVEPPIYRAFSEIERPINDVIAVSKGDEPSERWLRNAITPVGYFVGLPTGQVGTSAQYALDVAEGDQNPDSASDVLLGFAKGPREDQQ